MRERKASKLFLTDIVVSLFMLLLSNDSTRRNRVGAGEFQNLPHEAVIQHFSWDLSMVLVLTIHLNGLKWLSSCFGQIFDRIPLISDQNMFASMFYTQSKIDFSFCLPFYIAHTSTYMMWANRLPLPIVFHYCLL